MGDFTNLDSKEYILIKGAGLHNLKDINVAIPRNKLVVVTGLSGSGKSSLTFDTLYAEGQRRYVESLSSYARQFLGRFNKPKVEYIRGIAPAIAIEQKVNTSNPRSTVGTSTEIYDYIKLLFARIGKTISPISGNEVKKHQVEDVINVVKSFDNGSRWLLLAPQKNKLERSTDELFQLLKEQGFSRISINNNVYRLDDFNGAPTSIDSYYLVVDRIIVKDEEEFYSRLADAIQTAFYEGSGECVIQNNDDTTLKYNFSNSFELDGITFLEPNIHFFSFNNPYGACPQCEGFGNIIGIDEDLVIPNTSLSIYQNAIAPWVGESMSWYKNEFIKVADSLDFPIHRPYYELSAQQKQLLWDGHKSFIGIHDFFKELEEKSYKIQNRVMLSRYRGKTKCPTCKGNRLREEALYVKVGSKSIADLVSLPIKELQVFFDELKLNEYELTIANRLLIEIRNRLNFLTQVGLNYLTLNRNSNTLSGGESQRINLATSLGSSLVGSLYILDEPSIGLHPKDTEKLIDVLIQLRDLGNTVIVVEHDEDIMKAADEIIDIGPEAGYLGGEVVAQGSFKTILKSDSLTSQYLNGSLQIEVPSKRRKSNKNVEIIGARENNLKNINVTIPLEGLTVVTGVSGSGKSTLVKSILYPALQRQIDGTAKKPGQFTEIKGNISDIKKVEFIDQNPIGKSSRSNPVTYTKTYDDIRDIFSKHSLSKLRGYQPKHFSFNVDAGRCETCKGEGEVTIEMQFMADVHIPCETCQGKRFKKEILDVKIEQKNIDDILRLTVDEAIEFFKTHQWNKIAQKLQPLQDVGLGYVQLGQSSSTLSGGEAQRIKLASYLTHGSSKDKIYFIFDEPTTGLHFHDIKKLIKSFEHLIAQGHSILVIEHNLDLIKCADYVIDIGPEGGNLGGEIIATGTPEEIIKNNKSITGKYLKDKLK